MATGGSSGAPAAGTTKGTHQRWIEEWLSVKEEGNNFIGMAIWYYVALRAGTKLHSVSARVSSRYGLQPISTDWCSHPVPMGQPEREMKYWPFTTGTDYQPILNRVFNSCHIVSHPLFSSFLKPFIKCKISCKLLISCKHLFIRNNI